VPESTSIADLVIKLGIDASGVQSGLQSAAAATRAFKDKSGFDPAKAEMDAAAFRIAFFKKNNEEKKAVEQEASYARTRLLVQEQLTFERDQAAKVLAARSGIAAQKAAAQEASYARTRLLVQEQLTFERDQAAKLRVIKEAADAQKAAAKEASYARTRLLVQEQLTFERDQAAKLRMIKEAANAQKAAVQAQITANQPSIANFASQYQSINEERSAQAAAVVAARRARDIADAARMKVAATKAERDYANSLRQAEAATRSVMTIEERFRAERERLIRLAFVMNNQTGQYVLSATSLNRALTNLTISTIRQQQAQRATNIVMNQGADAARVMTGVIGQASFAAEDFIQGMVFGDVRSALLGASNNLTMVARGLISLQAPAFQTALATAAIPVGLAVAVVGAALLAENLSHAVAEARTLEELLRNALIGMARGDSVAAAQAAVRMSQLEREIRLRAQAGVTDPTALSNEIIRAENEQLRLKEKLLELEREIERNSRVNSVTAKEMVTLQLGGVESRSELEKALYKEIQSGDAARIASGREALNTIARMEAAASAGQRENYINEARKLYEQLNNMMLGNGVGVGEVLLVGLLGGLVGTSGALDGILSDLTALNALEDVFNTAWDGAQNIEDQTALLAIRERLEKMGITTQEQLDAQIKLMNELKQVEAEIADLETRHAAAVQLQIQNALLIKQSKEAALDAQREETTFLLRATEVQKELLRIKKEQQEYMGDEVGPPTLAQAALGIEFLQAQKDALVKEMHNAIPEVKGGLEQNTFSAQAKAFEQIQKKPDEQQKKMVELLASIDQALANGGHILLVP